MKKLTAIIASLAFALSAFSQDPIYSISLKNTDTFTIEGNRDFKIYGLSERMKPLIQEGKNRKILAADHQSGVTIRTSDPKISVQEILNQLSNQTESTLGSFRDTAFSAALEPNILLMAVDQKSVWNILLTKKEENLYLLSITCLIDE